MSTKRQRKAISLETKYSIIQTSQQGEKPKQLGFDFELSASLISSILANKEKVIHEYENNAVPRKNRFNYRPVRYLKLHWTHSLKNYVAFKRHNGRPHD